MSTADLYAPTRPIRHRLATIAEPPRAPAPAAPLLPAPDTLAERMAHPFATTVRVVRRDSRHLVLQALPSFSLIGLAAAFFVAAYGLAGWALANGAMAVAPVDSFLLGIGVLVLLHVAFRYLLAPLGCDQTYAFDRALGELTVTTRGLGRARVDRYKLRDVVKLHVNRVDDGIYDPGTLLVIFKGGGTLQFPAQPARPRRIAATADVVATFLGVPRPEP